MMSTHEGHLPQKRYINLALVARQIYNIIIMTRYVELNMSSKDPNQMVQMCSLVCILAACQSQVVPFCTFLFHSSRKDIFTKQKILIFFLFLYKNVCCGYSLEVPHNMFYGK